MKYLFSFFVAILISFSAFGQCVPVDTFSAPGLFPSYQNFPCADRGVPYSQTLYFRNFKDVGPVTIQSMTFDSITNLPLGLSWTANRQPPFYEADSFGCIVFSGTTNDAVGQYKLSFWVTLNIAGTTFSGEMGDLSQQFGFTTDAFRHYIRVKEQGNPCPPVDTSIAGNTGGGGGGSTPPFTTVFSCGNIPSLPQSDLGFLQITPDDADLACVERGVGYSELLHISIPSPAGPFNVDTLLIDSVVGLPFGIGWEANHSPALYYGNSVGCIRLTGVTNDAPGDYELDIWITYYVGGSPFSGEIGDLSTQFGLPNPDYNVRVINVGDTCILATGPPPGANPGNGVTGPCNPDPNLQNGIDGIYPADESLPCLIQGEPSFITLNFKNFKDLGPVTIQSMTFDSITNLPCGMDWNMDRPSRFYEADSLGCLFISGTPVDPPGQYKMGIWVTIVIAGTPISGEAGDLGAQFAAGDWSYRLRIKTPSGTCTALDTSGFNDLTATCNQFINGGVFGLLAGNVFYDSNGNGTKDAGEPGMANQEVIINPGNRSLLTNASGEYGVVLDTGSYAVSMAANSNWNISSSPTTYNVTLTDVDTLFENLDFGLTPADTIPDVQVSITGSPARPGFSTTHWITYENIGTVPSSGMVTYTYDTVFAGASADVSPSSTSGNEMLWNYTNLFPGEQKRIKVALLIPPDVNLLGDTLVSSATINGGVVDSTPANNFDVLLQEVTGSYDPNDKAVTPNHPDGVRPESTLRYTIRFQNTGTDTAFTVVIRDTLDTDLNVETFSMLGASHAYSLDIKDDRYVTWTFNNILLPDSNVNEPESHGFVKYTIDMNDNIAHGTEVTNLAGIYFDFNPPVITNTTKSEVNFFLGIADRESPISSYIYPNPTDGRATIVLGQYVNDFEVELYDYLGRKVLNSQDNRGNRFVMDDVTLSEGVYIYRVTSKGKLLSSGKLVVMQ